MNAIMSSTPLCIRDHDRCEKTVSKGLEITTNRRYIEETQALCMRISYFGLQTTLNETVQAKRVLSRFVEFVTSKQIKPTTKFKTETHAHISKLPEFF